MNPWQGLDMIYHCARKHDPMWFGSGMIVWKLECVKRMNELTRDTGKNNTLGVSDRANTEPFLQSKMGDRDEVTQLHSIFPSILDGYQRKDKCLPNSLFNIVPINHSEDFTSKEYRKLVKLFRLQDDQTIDVFFLFLSSL